MKEATQSLRPFLSILTVLMAIFMMATIKMEVRRLGYTIYSLSRTEKGLEDEKRKLSLTVAQLTRPDRIENIAQSRLQLAKADKKQIIQIAGRVTLGGE